MTDAAARGVAVLRILGIGTDPDLGLYQLQEGLPGTSFAEARDASAITSELWPALAEQIALLHNGPIASVSSRPTSRVRQLSDLLHGSTKII